MNPQALMASLRSLFDQSADLCIELTNFRDDQTRVTAIFSRVQRMLDEAQQRLDDARMLDTWHKQLHGPNPPEVAGNIYRQPKPWPADEVGPPCQELLPSGAKR